MFSRWRQFIQLTHWFPRATCGALTTLNLDCESSRTGRDKRLITISPGNDSTSFPIYKIITIFEQSPVISENQKYKFSILHIFRFHVSFASKILKYSCEN